METLLQGQNPSSESDLTEEASYTYTERDERERNAGWGVFMRNTEEESPDRGKRMEVGLSDCQKESETSSR